MPFVKVNDLNVHYIEQGVGQPVVLVHGNTSSSVWWEYTFARMQDAPYRLIAPDLRGRGETEGPSDKWTVEMLADDLWRFVQALGMEPPHLVGHSLGSDVVLQFAVEHKDQVKSLLLLNPGWVAGDMPAAIGDEARVRAMVADKAILRTALRGIAALHPDDENWKRLEEASLRQRDDASIRGPAALMAWKITDWLPTLAGIPTTVARGAGDVYISTEDVAMRAVNGIPGAKYEVIPNATHSPNVENPDAWVALLRRHLESVG